MKSALHGKTGVESRIFHLAAFASGPLGAILLLESTRNGAASASPFSWTLLGLSASLVLAPIVEELAFRGAVQDFLREWSWARHSWLGVSAANALTSVLFSLCHVPSHSLAMACLTMIPSIVLGKSKELSGSVVPCMWLHAWFNLCFIAVSMFLQARSSGSS